VYYGVREHAMGSIVNGLMLHGGLRPLGSTFLVFSDYMRPPIRLAALMEIPVIHVFTHDSVWLGEDGPTHQPIEHLDALRAIPEIHVYRPADARETVNAWRHALRRTHGPTLIVLTRQPLPVLDRAEGPSVPRPAGEAAVMREPSSAPRLVLAASGSEVSLCVAASELLEKEGISARVVSIPCQETFLEISEAELASFFPVNVPRLFVEAGTGHTWGRWMTDRDAFAGLHRFGASAPGKVVAEKLGLNAEDIAKRARVLVSRSAASSSASS
jgi:transketolase